MRIEDYKPGDELKIIKLFELVFKQPMSLEQWNWRFRDNPAGKYLIKLMWDEDKLVGHYAVSPLIMRIDGSDVLTAHSLATMTHPDYGGRGIFKTLSLALYDDLEKKHGCKAIWGFPNNNSHYAFIKSLAWENIAVLHTLGVSASKFIHVSGDLKVEEFFVFEARHEGYIDRRLVNHKVKIKRSSDYLNWRFSLKPSVQYKKFHLKGDNGLEGVMVTKIYPSSTSRGKFDLNIVELFLDNYDDLPSFITHVIESYKLDFDRATIWKNVFDPDHLALEKIGFVPVLPQTYLGARIHSTMVSGFGDLRNWYIAMGDSDVF